MTRIPVISGRDTVKRLEKAGYVLVRQKGSHIILRGGSPPVTISVPDRKEPKPGTLRNIIRQARLSVKEFVKLK